TSSPPALSPTCNPRSVSLRPQRRPGAALEADAPRPAVPAVAGRSGQARAAHGALIHHAAAVELQRELVSLPLPGAFRAVLGVLHHHAVPLLEAEAQLAVAGQLLTAGPGRPGQFRRHARTGHRQPQLLADRQRPVALAILARRH